MSPFLMETFAAVIRETHPDVITHCLGQSVGLSNISTLGAYHRPRGNQTPQTSKHQPPTEVCILEGPSTPRDGSCSSDGTTLRVSGS